MAQENLQKWIKAAMSKVIENLGPNVDDVQYELSGPNDAFMSSLYYISVKLKNKTTGQNEELSVVLKRPTQIEAMRKLINIDSQFHNEILFYRTYVQSGENFPKYFYLDERPPSDSVIALENVSKRGYHPSPHAYDPPLEHTLAAVREMGRFHGKGYVMKQQQREKFFNIVQQCQEVRYEKDSFNQHRFFINLTATRVVEYLRSRGHDATFCDKLESLLSNAFEEVMLKTIEPLEPLSTLCHGDFTVANTLFKKEDDGQYRAMLIDFALLRYGTPVIDLATFLCVSCPTEVRKEKFFEIMRAYHGALEEYLLEAGIRDVEKYSYDALLDDYRRGALFGFVILSFYLPTLLGYSSFEQIKETVEGIQENYNAELAKVVRKAGGDEVSKILADMLLHLKDLGCLQHIL